MSDDRDEPAEECPACGAVLHEAGLQDSWREFECEACGAELLRPLTDDHGGVSNEDLSNIASFTGDEDRPE